MARPPPYGAYASATFQSRQPEPSEVSAQSGRRDFCLCSRAVLGFVSSSLLSARSAFRAGSADERFHDRPTDAGTTRVAQSALTLNGRAHSSYRTTGSVAGGAIDNRIRPPARARRTSALATEPHSGPTPRVPARYRRNRAGLTAPIVGAMKLSHPGGRDRRGAEPLGGGDP
jgi:hypothetical protein